MNILKCYNRLIPLIYILKIRFLLLFPFLLYYFLLLIRRWYIFIFLWLLWRWLFFWRCLNLVLINFLAFFFALFFLLFIPFNKAKSFFNSRRSVNTIFFLNIIINNLCIIIIIIRCINNYAWICLGCILYFEFKKFIFWLIKGYVRILKIEYIDRIILWVFMLNIRQISLFNIRNDFWIILAWLWIYFAVINLRILFLFFIIIFLLLYVHASEQTHFFLHL